VHRHVAGLDAGRGSGILSALLFLVLSSPLSPAGAQADPEAWRRAGHEAISRAQALSRGDRARNVILFVGDGMGVSTVTAARILDGQLRGESGEENLLSFERLPHLALAKTYNTNAQVPDSAGTMTAMVTGVKTRSGVLSLDEDVARGDWRSASGHELPTLLELAEQRGMQTGIVTTTSVTHATPAACYAHVAQRNWEDDASMPEDARRAGHADIARQLIEFPHGDGIDIVLGGGRKRFLPSSVPDPEVPEQRGKRLDGRDLTAEWSAQDDGLFVSNRAQWDAIDWRASPRVLGLFAPGHLPFEAGRAESDAATPSLTELTAAAVDRLSQSREGYVLVVEAGRIDHAHHASSAYNALHATIELSRAVQATLDRIDLRETLVIVTADHDHTLTMGGYSQLGNPILGLVELPDSAGKTARDGLGRPYTTLGYMNGPGWIGPSLAQSQGAKHYPHRPGRWTGDAGPRPNLAKVDTQAPDYLQESAIPLRSETHAGHDVPIYAAGPGAHLIHGVQEQSYIFHVASEALKRDSALGWLERLFGD
jgi:alkaline phosphatase